SLPNPSLSVIHTLSLHDALPILLTSMLPPNSVAESILPMETFNCSLVASTPPKPAPISRLAEPEPALTSKVLFELMLVSELLIRSEEHTSELQSRSDLVCRLLLE